MCKYSAECSDHRFQFEFTLSLAASNMLRDMLSDTEKFNLVSVLNKWLRQHFVMHTQMVQFEPHRQTIIHDDHLKLA